jgi:hypothetical protein
MSSASQPFFSFQKFYTTAEIQEMLYPSPPGYTGTSLELAPGDYRVIDDELFQIVHGIPMGGPWVCAKDGAR